MNRLDFIKKSFLGLSTLLLHPFQTLNAEPKRIILYGDGIHDDTDALLAWAHRKQVYYSDYQVVDKTLEGRKFITSKHFFALIPTTGEVSSKTNKLRCVDCSFCLPDGREYLLAKSLYLLY